jgi:hypothetical protein
MTSFSANVTGCLAFSSPSVFASHKKLSSFWLLYLLFTLGQASTDVGAEGLLELNQSDLFGKVNEQFELGTASSESRVIEPFSATDHLMALINRILSEFQ